MGMDAATAAAAAAVFSLVDFGGGKAKVVGGAVVGEANGMDPSTITAGSSSDWARSLLKNCKGI